MTSLNIEFKVIKRTPANPQGLRWVKADNGQPITWSYNFTNNTLPFTNEELARKIYEQTFKIEQACNINLTFIGENIDSDIQVFFEPVDGTLNMLAFVYQPSSGNNMANCSVCGDIHIDNQDSYSLTDFGNIVLHEMLHSFGCEHSHESEVSEFSVLLPRYSFGAPEFFLGPWDINQLRMRYPG